MHYNALKEIQVRKSKEMSRDYRKKPLILEKVCKSFEIRFQVIYLHYNKLRMCVELAKKLVNITPINC